MMCSGLSVRVYMPGRCFTGSSPRSTRIELSEYAAWADALDLDAGVAGLFMRAIVVSAAAKAV